MTDFIFQPEDAEGHLAGQELGLPKSATPSLLPINPMLEHEVAPLGIKPGGGALPLPTLHTGEPTIYKGASPQHDVTIYQTPSGGKIEYAFTKEDQKPYEAYLTEPGQPTKYFSPEQVNFPPHPDAKPTLHVGPLTDPWGGDHIGEFSSLTGKTPEGGTIYYDFKNGQPQNLTIYDSEGNFKTAYTGEALQQFQWPEAPKAAEPPKPSWPPSGEDTLFEVHGPDKKFYGKYYDENIAAEVAHKIGGKYGFEGGPIENEGYPAKAPTPGWSQTAFHLHTGDSLVEGAGGNYYVGHEFNTNKPEILFSEPLQPTSPTLAEGKLENGDGVEVHYKNDEPVQAVSYDSKGKATNIFNPSEYNLPVHPSLVNKSEQASSGNKPTLHEGPVEEFSKYLLKAKTPEGGSIHYHYDNSFDPKEATVFDSLGKAVGYHTPDEISFPQHPQGTPLGKISFDSEGYPKLPKDYLTREERDLIGHHRFTRDIMEGRPPADIHKINDIIAKYPLPKGTPVWRGVSKSTFDKFDSVPIGATVFHSPLFQASSNEDFGKSWAPQFLEVVLPKGTPAFPASNYTGIREWEYLLQTGQRFKVLDKGYDDRYGKNYIRLELVPRFRPVEQDETQPLPHPLLGVHVYHSSPYEFKRFSSDQVGTGESTVTKAGLLQGYGHYVAEEPAVANKYFEIAKRKNVADKVVKDLQQGFNFPESKIEDILNRVQKIPTEELTNESNRYSKLNNIDPNEDDEAMIKAIEARRQLEYYGKPAFTYRALAHIDQNYMLDSDKSLAEQTPQVLAALKRAGIDTTAAHSVKQILPQSKEEMMNYLKAGIQGVRYLDRRSREKGYGTRNYVIYDDEALDIAKKGYMNAQGQWHEYND